MGKDVEGTVMIQFEGLRETTKPLPSGYLTSHSRFEQDIF
jgi:hypothetical protein